MAVSYQKGQASRKLFEHEDLCGKKFGRLTVVSFNGRVNRRRYYWNCVCDCGAERVVEGSHLRSGHTKSCGCYAREITRKTNFTHGKCKSRLYYVYRNMLNRCYWKKSDMYKNYGARGINVCEEWLGEKGFINFYNWAMSNGYDENAPKGKCTIDRINNDEGYYPDNCRWVDLYVQANNKRGLFIVNYNGKDYRIDEVCKIVGLNDRTIRARRRRGYTDAEIFEIPKGGKKVAERLQKNICN